MASISRSERRRAYSHAVRRLVTVAVWILVAACGVAAGTLALPRTGLRGHYFTNLTRSGTPVAVIIDESISTDTLDNGTAAYGLHFRSSGPARS